MELEKIIQKGFVREENFQVTEEYSAILVGSGGSHMLATPWLIAFMERVAFRILEDVLPEGSSSVGVSVDVRHTAPTAVGSTVCARLDR